MRVSVVTIFPEIFESALGASLLGKAIEAGLMRVEFVNPRDFTTDRHRSVDDAPYGGGPGMVMKVEPLVAAIEAACSAAEQSGDASRHHRVLLTPAGGRLTQSRVRQLAEMQHVLLVCGRYEGIDDRVAQIAIDEEISVGDFVMSGGEIAAMAVIDAMARYVPGVLGEAASTEEESFSDGLLEYPQYTRPASFRGLAVPDVLQSGNHARIREWRREQALARTASRRPDLLAGAAGDLEPGADPVGELAARTYAALAHYPVYDRTGRVVTTSVTNLDVHDIARSSATYGLAGYFVVTPVEAQRKKVERIVACWPERSAGASAAEPPPGEAAVPGGDDREDHRARALGLLRTAESIDAVIDEVTASHGGQRPIVVATSADPARFPSRAALDFDALPGLCARRRERALLLVFGTGWGLAQEAITKSDHILAAIRGHPEFNHLSVRSAACVIFDRLFGLRA